MGRRPLSLSTLALGLVGIENSNHLLLMLEDSSRLEHKTLFLSQFSVEEISGLHLDAASRRDPKTSKQGTREGYRNTRSICCMHW